MRQLATLLNGLAKSLYGGGGSSSSRGRKSPEIRDDAGKEAADVMVREAKKNDLILKSSGVVAVQGSNGFVSVFSRRGEKGINQDCSIVWQEYGFQEDMMFCGLFDGHGPWGHYVAKMVRESLPPSLLCNWQQALAQNSLLHGAKDGRGCRNFDIWKQSYIRARASVDAELKHHRKMDSFNNGTTALTIIKQGNLMVLANVGDSRAVLETRSDDGSLVPVQLTVDFKPDLPKEAERIAECKGLVFCFGDEPGVHRMWLPNKEMPGLAMSRAFGDYCVKDFGLISEPEVTQRMITNRDQFIVLATDGVWDVISNQEAAEIVSSTKDRGKAAKRLVECAGRAWRRKRRDAAVDDFSAICLFFSHSNDPLYACNAKHSRNR